LEGVDFLSIIWSSAQTIVNPTITRASLIIVTAKVWLLVVIVDGHAQLGVFLEGSIGIPLIPDGIHGLPGTAILVTNPVVTIHVPSCCDPGHVVSASVGSALFLANTQVVIDWRHISEISVSLRIANLLSRGHDIGFISPLSPVDAMVVTVSVLRVLSRFRINVL